MENAEDAIGNVGFRCIFLDQVPITVEFFSKSNKSNNEIKF